MDVIPKGVGDALQLRADGSRSLRESKGMAKPAPGPRRPF
jgi:hypothetical protein